MSLSPANNPAHEPASNPAGPPKATGPTRSALVTGASRGIGRGIAEHLARQGWSLTITSRSKDELAALAPTLCELGAPEVTYLAADMADHHRLADLVNRHVDTFDTMDALIINAGVGTAGRVDTYRLDRLTKTFDVNFVAAFTLIQAALPHLRKAANDNPTSGAKIVAISSITGAYAEPRLAVYGASKAALLSLIETVSLEEADTGVTASAIAPAYVQTNMSAWVTDTVPADSMIKINDIVLVVDMLLTLSRAASIPRIVVSRSGTSGYSA